MNNMNNMIKCGIMNNCINDSLVHYKKLVKQKDKIIQKILSLRKITGKQIENFKNTYKLFAKHFFSKKTIKCMKNFCKSRIQNITKIKKNIDELKKKILATKTKFILIDKTTNYVKLLDAIFVILGHFGKNYQRFR